MRQDKEIRRLERLEVLDKARDEEERAQLAHAMAALEKAAGTWREELPSPWRPSRKSGGLAGRGPFWLVWMPLAACLVMAVLVVFRVQVISGEDGFRISFGSPDPAPPFTPDLVAAQLADYQVQTANMVAAVLDNYRRDQDKYLEQMVVRLGVQQREQRGEDLKTLVSAWQVQRREDLSLMEQRFQTILVTQQRQASNIYSLASYVNQSADPVNRL